MADIQITCVQCDKCLMVSEFADIGEKPCPDCGARMQRGAKDADAAERPALRIRREPPPTAPTTPSLSDSEAEPTQTDKMRHLFEPGRGRATNVQTSHAGRQQSLIVWGLFILVGSASLALRYLAVLPELVPVIQEYAWTLIVLMYGLTVVSAFKENVLQGLMCLLIPGYFLYFLLMFDRAYLRAVTFGLLLGLGADTWSWIGDRWSEFYHQAMDWILSGGGK